MNQDITASTTEDSGAEEETLKKRRLLIGATGAIGAGAGLAAATPFVASLRPSKKAYAEGAPVSINIKGLTPGELRRDVWRLKPIWVLGRNDDMLSHAKSESADLADPESQASLQPAYCQNENRSIKPGVFVAVGLCTHLGCSPGQVADKKRGFLCACHGSRFDVAGRVFAGSPAPDNLIIPPHRYVGDDEIIIGEDDVSA